MRQPRLQVPEEHYQPPQATATTYDCTLVTPLYGGGVQAGKVDTALPIRPSALRGQLRFWWRVACGPFESPRAMFADEIAIWGGIGAKKPTASRVRVRVADVSNITLEPAFTYKRDSRPDKHGQFRTIPDNAGWANAYALFSAQGKLTADKRSVDVAPNQLAIEKDEGKGVLKFSLLLQLDHCLTDEQRQGVQKALRWWASFGGLGARTRRGLGAVQVMGLERVTPEEVEDRGGWLVLRRAETSANAAWRTAVNRLKIFRQGVNEGRNAGQSANRPGRSRWPEADAIRRLSAINAPLHAPTHPAGNVFPRAAFGLPIVFHFQSNSDPTDHTLEPAGAVDRMASPLILRSYWNGQEWCPAALLLPGWEQALSQPLKFKTQPTRPMAWPANQTEEQRLAQLIKPMQGRGEDVLSAFMQFF